MFAECWPPSQGASIDEAPGWSLVRVICLVGQLAGQGAQETFLGQAEGIPHTVISRALQLCLPTCVFPGRAADIPQTLHELRPAAISCYLYCWSTGQPGALIYVSWPGNRHSAHIG